MKGSYDIMIVRIGGQGTILASNILGEACLIEGRSVRGPETHGMAQRGGSVVNTIRAAEVSAGTCSSARPARRASTMAGAGQSVWRALAERRVRWRLMQIAGRRIVAVIDLGSNSARLLVARGLSATAFEVVDEERFDARLGEGLSDAGLSPAAFERGLHALRAMVQVARSFSPADLIVVGTEALRRASDAGTFVERAWREAGVRVRVLTGEEEAYGGFLGVVYFSLFTSFPARPAFPAQPIR